MWVLLIETAAALLDWTYIHVEIRGVMSVWEQICHGLVLSGYLGSGNEPYPSQTQGTGSCRQQKGVL